MGFFRRARVEEVVRYETPDGEDWVEMRAELSKREVNSVIQHVPKDQSDVAGGFEFVKRFLAVAVTDWSMTDEQGSPVPFSIDAYEALTFDAAQWFDQRATEHLQKTIGREVEEAEGKASN